MRITFYKLTEPRVSTWEAVRKERSRTPGSTMALSRGGMPHAGDEAPAGWKRA